MIVEATKLIDGEYVSEFKSLKGSGSITTSVVAWATIKGPGGGLFKRVFRTRFEAQKWLKSLLDEEESPDELDRATIQEMKLSFPPSS